MLLTPKPVDAGNVAQSFKIHTSETPSWALIQSLSAAGRDLVGEHSVIAKAIAARESAEETLGVMASMTVDAEALILSCAVWYNFS